MGRQLGFGWGRGRRVIKTTLAGETLTRALAKQQRFVDEHRVVVDETRVLQGRELLAALEQAPGARRQPLHLRMAKAEPR